MWNNSLRELWNLMLRIKWNEINPLTPAGISHCEALFHTRSVFHKSRKGFISLKKTYALYQSIGLFLAEAVRFELTVGLTPSLVFKTSSINHSDKPPHWGQFSIFLETSLELRCRRNITIPKVLLPQRLFWFEVPKCSPDFKTAPLWPLR